VRDGPVVEITDLTVDVPGPAGPVRILDSVDVVLHRGTTLGIVGESGSGKSMTLRSISRLLPAGSRTGGSVTVDGQRVDTLTGRDLRRYRRGNRVATVFQDPRSAINPIQRVEDFLLEAARDAHRDVDATRLRAVALLRRMGIDDPERRMAQYPFELSGGLLQRIMIASVLLVEPDVILADEPTTALDVTTQSDVLAITAELRAERSTSMIFVTHDLDLALAICDRVLVLYAGRVLEVADAAHLRAAARHPYTRGLLAARPPLDVRRFPLPVIAGVPVAAAQAGPGCPFVSRCPVRVDRCAVEMPAVSAYAGGTVRCHVAEMAGVG
jgi:oligopeptide/dipeptide ABC transporter ATP-binding protein